MVVGVAVPALAWVNWMRAERALRNAQPLPASLLGPVIAAAVTITGALVLLSILFA
ncbi:hypothetical protein [Microbacterium kunmingense]|uniref:hypothetical protein n=1 Tax=Microbacterium kunmingense TaxID=2915939 RepID=UPI0020047E26|nr:hypothetical protein [Microbacterium kunmingense]